MNPVRVLLSLAAILAPFATAAQTTDQRRALAIEDYYRVLDVGSLELSDDGRWVAFTVSRRIEETNDDSTEVWLAPTNGAAAARRVSRPGQHARAPSWTDDGRLYYLGGRAFWALEPERPDEVRRFTNRRAGGTPSPDGRWIFDVQETPASPPPVAARPEFIERHESRFRGVQFDWLNFQRDGSRLPVPDPRDPVTNPASEIFLTAAEGAEERQLTRLGLQPRAVTWAAGGELILFTADSAYRDEHSYNRADLWTVSLDGTVNRLTRGPRYNHGSVRVSPDGNVVAFVRTYATDYVIREKLNHGGPTDLWIMPVRGGNAVNLTADWDLEAGTPTWSPDGRWIYFTAEVSGGRHLFRVPADGGPIERITYGERSISGLAFDTAFRRMAYMVDVHHAPAEVWTAEIDGSNERQLTRVHEPFIREVALSRAERLLYPSYDGTPIEGWLLYPYGYRPDGGPYPLVVVSHGGPHSASGYGFSFKNQFFAANGYFVLETNFRSSTGYGEDFLWSTWGAWGTKDGQDVMAGIDHVLSRFPIDRDRVGHMGHSYGGFMTNWLITQYPDRFAAAISGAGISNWVSDYGTADIARTKETEFLGYPWDPVAREVMIRQSPLTYAGRVRTPTLFVHGEDDQRVPYEEAEQMYTALRKQGIPAKMIVYRNMPHGIRGSWNNVHRMLNELAWWDRWLKPASTGTSTRHEYEGRVR